MTACLAGQTKAARVQLAKGASLDITPRSVTPMLLAARKCCEALAAISSLQTFWQPREQDRRGRTLLHLACAYGHFDCAQQLIDAGADVDAVDDRNRSPLHLACARGRFDCAQTLIDAGADVDAVDEWYRSPLHVACANGHEAIVRLLIYCRADVHAYTAGQCTPLYYAATRCHAAVVSALLTNGAFVDTLQTTRDRTALHGAGDDVVSLMLIDHGARVDIRDRCGVTPLQLVAEGWGSDAKGRVLVEAGAEITLHLLDLAGRNRRTEFVRMALDQHLKFDPWEAPGVRGLPLFYRLTLPNCGWMQWYEKGTPDPKVKYLRGWLYQELEKDAESIWAAVILQDFVRAGANWSQLMPAVTLACFGSSQNGCSIQTRLKATALVTWSGAQWAPWCENEELKKVRRNFDRQAGTTFLRSGKQQDAADGEHEQHVQQTIEASALSLVTQKLGVNEVGRRVATGFVHPQYCQDVLSFAASVDIHYYILRVLNAYRQGFKSLHWAAHLGSTIGLAWHIAGKFGGADSLCRQDLSEAIFGYAAGSIPIEVAVQAGHSEWSRHAAKWHLLAVAGFVPDSTGVLQQYADNLLIKEEPK